MHFQKFSWGRSPIPPKWEGDTTLAASWLESALFIMCTLPFLNPGWTTAIMMMMMRMMGNIPAVFQPLLFSHHQYNHQTVWTQPISLIRHPTGWHITVVFFPGFQLATGKKGRFLYYLVKAGGQPALGRLSVITSGMDIVLQKVSVVMPKPFDTCMTHPISCSGHLLPLFGSPCTIFWNGL